MHFSKALILTAHLLKDGVCWYKHVLKYDRLEIGIERCITI